MGTLVVISSPSGAGKNSIIRRLLEILPNSARFVTTTTRSPRPGEYEGKDYFFVTHEKFEGMLQANKFIEHNTYAGEYYGTEKEKLSRVREKYDYIFVALDVNGKHALDALHIPHVSIFLVPEDMTVLEDRIQVRGGVSEEEMKERMQTAREELKAADAYDRKVVNPEGKMEDAVQEIVQFLQEQK